VAKRRGKIENWSNYSEEEEEELFSVLLLIFLLEFCRENGLLKETKSELEHAIAETERPLR
jgi:hypothetical protein